MRSQDGGLTAAVYAPCVVNTKIDDRKVNLKVETEYPFRETVTIHVSPETAFSFPLRLRIPMWADRASLSLNGQPLTMPLKSGSFVRIERRWEPHDRLTLVLPMVPKVGRWFNDSVALTRGPLVFSYEPGSSFVKLRDRGPTADWQVFREKAWNYALHVNEASAASIKVTEHPVGPTPFASASAPVTLEVSAQRVDGWLSEDGVALPIARNVSEQNAPARTIRLIPYGSAKLRVTAFPEARLS